MASERFWAAILADFTGNGNNRGVIQVESSKGFKVKANVLLNYTGLLAPLNADIKSVPDEYTIEVGPPGSDMTVRTDLSAFTVALDAQILQPKQKRPPISMGDWTRAIYEEEPTVAVRVIPVDESGSLIDFSVDGIVPQEFDKIVLNRDINTEVIVAKFYESGQLLWTLDIVRDINEDVSSVTKVLP